jgi:hypothetical protein
MSSITVDKSYMLNHIASIDPIQTNRFSKGVSSSEVWFIRLTGVAEDICMKYHISSDSIRNIDPMLYHSNESNIIALTESTGLDYEVLVYRHIQNLMNNNICNSFINSYGYITFNYDELLQLAINCGISEYQLNRNIYMMRITEPDRSVVIIGNDKYPITYNHENNTNAQLRIDKNNNLITKHLDNFKKYEFVAQFTETFDMSSLTSLFVFGHSSGIDKVLKAPMLLLILQSLIGCYALQLIKTNHNDLMLGNILVRSLCTPEEITYIVNGNVYTITTKHRSYIYDYDRAYSKVLSKNVNLETSYSTNFSQYNEVVPTKDAFQIIQGMYYLTNSIEEKSILKSWLGISNDDKYWNTILSHPCSLVQEPNTSKSVPIDKFTELNSVECIIENVVAYMKDLVSDKITTKNLQIMHPDMFDKYGTIITDNVKRERAKYV